MPTLVERTIPYEVLIRFGPDGLIQGMHAATRTQVLRDGDVVSDVPNPPVTVTAGKHEGIQLDGVLSQMQTSLMESLESKTAEAKGLVDAVAALTAELNSAKAIAETKTAELDEALKANEAARDVVNTERAARNIAESKAAMSERGLREITERMERTQGVSAPRRLKTKP